VWAVGLMLYVLNTLNVHVLGSHFEFNYQYAFTSNSPIGGVQAGKYEHHCSIFFLTAKGHKQYRPATTMSRPTPRCRQVPIRLSLPSTSDSSSQGLTDESTEVCHTPLPVVNVVLATNNAAVREALVVDAVNNAIFPKKQFIVLEDELSATGKIATCALKFLNMPGENWEEIRGSVRRRLTTRRNNAQGAVRKAMTGMCELEYYVILSCCQKLTFFIACMKKSGSMYPMDRILKLREDHGVFEWFLDKIGSVVLGVGLARKEKTHKLPSEWLTVGLEAFALLCLENYWDMILGQVNNRAATEPPKWTADGRGKKKNQGWDQDGIRRYNELVSLVKNNRQNDNTLAEERYLQLKRAETHSNASRLLQAKLAALRQREQGLVAAVDEL
jgi:hypothetical protein